MSLLRRYLYIPIYIYIKTIDPSIDGGERRGKKKEVLLLGCMNKRQGVYTTDDKSYRGSDRDACRGTVARIATRRPSPPPPLEAEVGSNVSNAEFNVLCSVFERFRAIESAAPRKRGSRRTTPLPPPTPDRAVSRSLSLSLYPFRPAPPSSSSPCLSVSPWLRTANTPGGSTHLRHLTSDQPSQPSIHSAYLPTHLPTYRHLFTRLSLESRIGESAVQPLARHPPPPTTEG